MNSTPTIASPKATFDHLPTLDGLRAVSIILVMMSHFIAADLIPGGLGVLVFFAISGFLITRLLVSEYYATGSVNLRNFYARRALRLYPVIIAYTIITTTASLSINKDSNISIIEPISALFYFSNYYYSITAIHGVPQTMPFENFWSLSVEEHFYIFFPIIFVAFISRPRHLVIAVIGLCILPLAARLMFAHFHPLDLQPQWHWATYLQTQYRIDSIAFGVLLALLCDKLRNPAILARLGHPVVFGGAITVLMGSLIFRDPWFRETWRYTIQSAAVVLILMALLFSPRVIYEPLRYVLNTRPIVWIGKLSYSLYLWHFFIGDLIHQLAPQHISFIALTLEKFTLSFALAAASYYCFEIPFAGLRRRFGSRQTENLPATPNSATLPASTPSPASPI